MKLTDIKTREQIPVFLESHSPGAIGVELGVHLGEYSEILLANSNSLVLHSIDRWGGDRGHGDPEHEATLKRLKRFGKRSQVIKASFDEALETFPNESLGFIYIDGYAHTGQDDGKTIQDWWKKVKPGGFFGGHDYYSIYPQTIAQVDRFVKDVKRPLHVTGESKFQSWMIIK